MTTEQDPIDYWMYNNDLSIFRLFRCKAFDHNGQGKWNKVNIMEYTIHPESNIDDPDCILEEQPFRSASWTAGHEEAQQAWQDYIRQGFLMMDSTVGVITSENGRTLLTTAAARENIGEVPAPGLGKGKAKA